MTVTYPDAFHRSPAAGFDGVFDWDFLIPAFEGTGIQPMDFDGVVERNGQFLVFETKEGNKPIPFGQQLALERAVETGFWTVIVLRAKRSVDVAGWDCWFLGKKARVTKKYIEGDATALVAFVRRWFLSASRRKPS